MVQLIGFEANRITVLFMASPDHGQPHLPALIKSLVERYSFAVYPRTIEEVAGEKIIFRQGLFRNLGIEELAVYKDGIVVNSRSDSDFIEEFLEDLYKWLAAQGISRINTHKLNKIYDCRLIFKSEVDIPKKLQTIDHLAKTISMALRDATGIDATYQSSGISLSADATKSLGLKPSEFRLERRAGQPFESDLYYSAAPLPTKAHIKILNSLEKL
jgi:hypothetical protein